MPRLHVEDGGGQHQPAGLRDAGGRLGRVSDGNPAFVLTPTAHNERYEVVASYADRDLLQSGWLVGEDTLARTGAAVVAHVGTGKIVLLGFHAAPRADVRHVQAAVQHARRLSDKLKAV